MRGLTFLNIFYTVGVHESSSLKKSTFIFTTILHHFPPTKLTSSLPSSTLVENVGVLISLDLESGVIDTNVPILPYWVRTTNM